MTPLATWGRPTLVIVQTGLVYIVLVCTPDDIFQFATEESQMILIWHDATLCAHIQRAAKMTPIDWVRFVGVALHKDDYVASKWASHEIGRVSALANELASRFNNFCATTKCKREPSRCRHCSLLNNLELKGEPNENSVVVMTWATSLDCRLLRPTLDFRSISRAKSLSQPELSWNKVDCPLLAPIWLIWRTDCESSGSKSLVSRPACLVNPARVCWCPTNQGQQKL